MAEPKEEKTDLDKVLTAIGKILDSQEKLEDKVLKLEKKLIRFETGKDDRFKEEVKSEDIEKAKVGRENVDPRIVKIVDEMLGEDFAIKVLPQKDRPGFTFTITVPFRLSLLPEERRPIKNKATGGYVKNKQNEVQMEVYQPEDNRSRIIASTDSFDAIKNHCEKVRANIVATYQKINKPLPEFRIKQFVQWNAKQ